MGEQDIFPNGMRNDQLDNETIYTWFERLGYGDYGKAIDGTWYAKIPNGPHAGSHGNLKNHIVTEHEDGTITVSPSILVEYGDGKSWHGYLEKGIWRTV